MKRVLAALAVVVVVASVATGVLVWRLAQNPPPAHPEISAYTDGQMARVGPYFFCQVRNPTDCENPQSSGELVVDRNHPVQLSVPPAISRGLWFLVRSYEGGEVTDTFRAHTRLAVTIPTYDPQKGRLFGLAVQLPGPLEDEAGNPYLQAEWSVSTVWP